MPTVEAPESIQIEGYKVRISRNPDLERLREQWNELSALTKQSYFLDWRWMGNWIDSYSPQLIEVSASFDGRQVALGLFTLSVEKRHGFVRSRQLRLQQCGNQSLDQVWIEYNDFLCHPAHRPQAVNACYQALYQSTLGWDEIIVSMMPCERLQELRDGGISVQVELTTPCFSVDLQQVRERNLNYLQSLSANTRYQVRRSEREYRERMGEISLQSAQTSSEAVDFFMQAGDFHRRRWPDSGYTNSHFIRFHQRLIERQFESGGVELIRVNAGHTTIAMVYNLLLNDGVYFYLHGLIQAQTAKMKPGLLAHARIAQYYLEKGKNFYDFMGGESQYKRQLALHTRDCCSISLQRPRLQFSIEKLGYRLKQLILR